MSQDLFSGKIALFEHPYYRFRAIIQRKNSGARDKVEVLDASALKPVKLTSTICGHSVGSVGWKFYPGVHAKITMPARLSFGRLLHVALPGFFLLLVQL
jgi:hypothetical protein